MSVGFLSILQPYINLYGMGILLILGDIGNILVILLFRQHRKTACSVYLSSAALINIVYLTFNISIIIDTYMGGSLASSSLIFCKLRFYLSHVFGQMARYFIVLVCFDRYVITNINFRRRSFNRPNIAKRLILFVTIFWCIIGSHQLMFTKINNGQCGQFGIYYTINNIYVLISFSITPPVLMSTFGYLAYRQLKQSIARLAALENNQNTFIVHRRDRELLIMILTEVFIYLFATILQLAINLELLLEVYITTNKTVEHIQIENFILILSVFLVYMNHAAPFYIYILVSKGFRHDFKKLFKTCCQQITTVSVIGRV